MGPVSIGPSCLSRGKAQYVVTNPRYVVVKPSGRSSGAFSFVDLRRLPVGIAPRIVCCRLRQFHLDGQEIAAPLAVPTQRQDERPPDAY
jgi:hypothetical protein